MPLIADSAQLAAFCARVSQADFITVDTEFMRERTYWPQLCLIQVAGPDEVAAIDPLAEGMDLTPLLDLLADERLLKVFHAARQDIEIFFHLTGRIPTPLFDTQVAAMVCGYGDSVSYETLAAQLAGARIDKSVRFTDWSARPLSDRQISYALADVTHLRKVYEGLAKRLVTSGRAHWLQEEMATLLQPGTYRLEPDESWRRLKPRAGSKPRLLAILREVAAWREREAQRRDVPRNRIVRDDTVMDIAAHAPSTVEDLARLRGLSKSLAEGRMGQDILVAVARGAAMPESEIPILPPPVEMPGGLGPVVELLKVLLKIKCERQQVAQKLVASSADLERVAADDNADVPALHGWRREVFGEDALALKHGRLALAMKGKRIVLMPLDEAAPAETKLRA
jgi:ribonuclease D